MDKRQEVIKYIASVEKQLYALFGNTYHAALKLTEVRKAIESGASFTWKGNPAAERKLDRYLSLRKRPGGRLGCKRYSFATFLFFGGNEFIRSVSGSSVVRTADGRVLAGICGSSVGRGKAGRNSIFVLSVGSWEKLLSGVSKSTTR